MKTINIASPPPLSELVDNDKRALFLDFDGTLLDLATSPDAIFVPEELPSLLRRLHERLDGALAILTGRSLADLDGYLPGLELPAAGQHGAERRLHSGDVASTVLTSALAAARGEIAQFKAAHSAILVEDKGASLALHYRSAPEQHGAIAGLSRRLVAESDGALEVIEGKAVCEIRPAGSNKGAALRALLAEAPFGGRLPLALGDDVTDEAAFGAALAANGQAIKVGDGPTEAGWRLADPAAVRAWLAQALA